MGLQLSLCDAQKHSSCRLVSLDTLQYGPDVPKNCRRKSPVAWLSPASRGIFENQVIGANHGTARHNRTPEQRILQLANIPRPRVR
tara:strand:+ start:268 stop:525 length:258 start_codon:yes stop_codon:yes gene_type:complete